MIGLLVTGSRDWTDIDLIRSTLQKHKDEDIQLIHGNCIGVDKICGLIGRDEFKWSIKIFNPNWNEYRKAGGPIRNKQMVDYLLSNFDHYYMYAFHDNLSLSKGTKQCVNYAISKNIKVHLVQHE